MNAFDEYMTATIEQAGREAHADASATIEAEHLLLAMAAQSTTDVGEFLEHVGLGHGSLRAALERESDHALKSVGIALDPSEKPRPKPSGARSASDVGSSFRLALERGFEGVRGKPRPAHVLLGVLEAELGRVPRALALAGVDRAALVARLRQALLG